MASLTPIVADRTGLDETDLGHLRSLVAQWQLLADLSFADLVLWVPSADPGGFIAAAQQRPTTAPTAHPRDVVGTHLDPGQRLLLEQAFWSGQIRRDADPEWHRSIPVRVEAIPVRRAGDAAVIAVVARTTNLLGIRTPSRLEITYLKSAGELASMISQGLFPQGEPAEGSASPRVGDGCIRVDAAGLVQFASPNAQSAFRRLGLVSDLTGQQLAEVTRTLLATEAVNENLLATASGRLAGELEIESAAAVLVLRAIPLRPGGQHTGALILLRDVTELRGRERELLTKDATIREIHHRVKNNLQTVAALLRLQARRISQPEARAALSEAVQRVSSIAIVHETLSQSFDEQVEFDQVADQLADLVTSMAASAGQVRAERAGSFGVLPAGVAASLATVLAELLQNAVQHGIGENGGVVRLAVSRDAVALRMEVIDPGPGLPADFDAATTGKLGLSIVRTLVTTELGGRVEFASPGMGGGSGDSDCARGTAVRVQLPSPQVRRTG